VYSFQTGETRIVESAGSPDAQAIWLPDGRGFLQIVLSSRRPITRNWTQFDPTSGTLRPSRNLGDPGFFSVPALSPDGRTIFRLGGDVRGPNGDLDNQNGEYSLIVAVDTSTGTESTVFKLANHRGSAGGPALSPDGRTLAFQWQPSQKVGTWILATIAVDGTGYREITTTSSPAHDLSWTRDGRALLFTANGGRASNCRLMRVSTGGGSHEFTGLEYARSGLLGCKYSVSPDGKRVAFQTSQGAQELWAIDVSEAALLKKAR
jgi:Tol biopolymer transport system component